MNKKLRTSGIGRRDDVKVGECFYYGEDPADEYRYLVVEEYDALVVNDIVKLWKSLDIYDVWDWSTPSKTVNKSVITFIPRWDAGKVAETKNSGLFPHKCLFCGNAAYVGFNSAEHQDASVKCSAR